MAIGPLLNRFYASRFGQHFRASLIRDVRAEMEADLCDREARAAEHGASMGVDRVQALLSRTRADRRPQTERLTEVLRDLEHFSRNAKVLGSALARQLHAAAGLDTRAFAPHPRRIDLTGKLCVQADIESEWFSHWCGQLRMAPVYHRKVWEDCFVAQALWEAGMLAPGRAGLGFAVGKEKIPSFLTARGVRVVATDLPEDDQRAAGWQSSNEHASSLLQLHDPDLCGWEVFESLCSFRPVNMNHIPDDLRGGFDFCWSVCSFEHLGSIEHGLAFFLDAMRCLKPGGVAVHTTEFNLSTGDETIDFHNTVLYQRRHIDDLARRLDAEGHSLLHVDYDPGGGPLDAYVDTPPYPHDRQPSVLRTPDAPHLRLSADGFPVTAIGLIARAKG